MIRTNITPVSVAGLVLGLLAAPSPIVAGDDPPASAPAEVGVEPRPDEELSDDLELLRLEVPVVVAATRRAQRISTLPHAVTVITQEDIRRSGARSAPDTLRLAPGMDIAEMSYADAAVAPRGIYGRLSREVLVLVDGRAIYDALFGGANWGSWPFQLEDIDRIEVIRGPAGVTWGANAMSGVINIVTKDPADQKGLTFTGGGGSRGTHKEHLGYAFEEGKLRLRVSGEFEASDGFRGGGNWLRPLDEEYKAGRSALHAIYDAGPKDTFTFSLGNALVENGFPPALGHGISPDQAGSQASFLLGKWRHQIAEDNAVEFTGYVNDFHWSAGLPTADYRYQQLALQFAHTFKPAAAHTLTWGMDSRLDLVDATNSDPFALSKDFVSTATFGAYVENEWRFAPRWALTLGGSVYYESYGGFEPSARASLSYEPTDTSLVYAAVSRAYQMAPGASRFFDLAFFDGAARLRVNREIDAEHLIAYELGYRAKLFERLDTNVNLFWHELDDLTAFAPRLGPPGLVTLDTMNAAQASIYGVEWDARYRATTKLTLLAHYTYQIAQYRNASPLLFNDNLAPPKHKAMIGSRYDVTDDLNLSTHLYYVDAAQSPAPNRFVVKSSVPAYLRWDLRAEHEFWGDRASIAVGVRNLLDSGHREGGTVFFNGGDVPRMIYAELRLAIQ